MGGRSGPTYSGSSAVRIRRHLAKSSPQIAAEVVMEVVATTNPTVAALYVAYKVTKFIYPIVQKGVEEYQKSGDSDKATEKMKEETVKQTGKEIVKASVGVVVKASYTSVVDSANLKTDKTVDTLVTSVASKVIEEVVVEEAMR